MHDKRLPQCEEKFKDVEKTIGELWKKKSDIQKGNGWVKITVSFTLSIVMFIVGTVYWSRLNTVEAKAETRDIKIENKQEEMREKYQEIVQELRLNMQDVKKDLSYIIKNMEKK